MHKDQRSSKVHIDHLGQVHRFIRIKPSTMMEARIVHNDVQLSKRRHRLVDQFFHCAIVADVSWEDQMGALR